MVRTKNPCRSIPVRGPFDLTHLHTSYTATTSVLRQLALNTRVHISARQCQGHCRKANPGPRRDEARQGPSTPVPHLKRRTVFSALALHFRLPSVSTFPSLTPNITRRPTHYCNTTGTWNVTHQASPTATSRTLSTLCLAITSTLRPLQRRWKPDANTTLPHRLSCPDRAPVRERKRVN